MSNGGGIDEHIVGEEFGPEYTECLKNHPDATPFHTLAWRQAVDRSFDYTPSYRVFFAADTTDIVAAVPGFQVPELVGTSFKNPFCEYGYPLILDSGLTDAVLSAITQDEGWFDTTVLKDAGFTGISGYAQAGFGAIETGVTYRLPIGTDTERIRKTAFDAELRRKIRRAEEAGLRANESNDLDAFYRLYLRTMQRLGSPQFPKKFFEALFEAFGSSCRLWVVTDEEPIAGVLSLIHNGTCFLLVNGSDPDRFGEFPNHLLYASFIEELAEEHISVIDFGRSEPGSGVAHFKEEYGAISHRLASFVTPARRVNRADVSGYKKLAPVTRLASPLITHPSIGPRLKELVHE